MYVYIYIYTYIYIYYTHTHTHIYIYKHYTKSWDNQKEGKYLSAPTAFVTDLIWLIIMSPGWGG